MDTNIQKLAKDGLYTAISKVTNKFISYLFLYRSELGETDTESEIGAHGRKGRRVSL